MIFGKGNAEVVPLDVPAPRIDWEGMSDSDKLTYLCETVEGLSNVLTSMTENAARNPLLKGIMGL